MANSLSEDSNEITTIKLRKKTKERLEKLRIYKRETYDEILEQILDILNLVKIAPERARGKLIAIDRKKITENREIQRQSIREQRDKKNQKQNQEIENKDSDE